MTGPTRSWWRCLLSVLLAATVPFALDGCVSIKMAKPTAAASPQWGAFRFLAVVKAEDRGEPFMAARGVQAALFRLGGPSGKEEQVVWRDTRGDWTVRDLPAGRYFLRIEGLYDHDGGLQKPKGDEEKDFSIKAGEATQANVVLQKTPVGVIVALSVTVVLLVALLVIMAQHGDLDLPDVPDLSGLAPYIPPLFPEMAEAALEFSSLVPVPDAEPDEDDEEPDEPEETGIVSYAPADGTLVDTDAVVDVELESPADSFTVDQRTFGLFAQGHQIPAAIAMRGDGTRLHLEPLQPLPSGARVTVRLMGEHIEGAGIANYEWSFEVR